MNLRKLSILCIATLLLMCCFSAVFAQKQSTWLQEQVRKLRSENISLRCITLGDKYMNKGKYKIAEYWFLEAGKMDRFNPLVQTRLIATYSAMKNYKMVAELTSRTVNFTDCNSLYNVAMLYLEAAQAEPVECKIQYHRCIFFLTKVLEIQLAKKEKADIDMISQVYSDLAYIEAINHEVQRGGNDKKHLHIPMHSLDSAAALYVKALQYNDANEVARANLDSIAIATGKTYTLDTAHLHKPQRKARPAMDSTDHAQLIADSLFQSLDINLLPAEYNQMLEDLSDFEELTLVIDYSGSMEIMIGGQSRMTTAIELNTFLIKALPPKIKIGAVSVGGSCGQVPFINFPVGSSRLDLLNAIQRPTNGGTPLNGVLRSTPTLFSKQAKKKAIVLSSDGLDGCDSDNICAIAQFLKESDIQVNVVSFLLEGNYETGGYRCLTELTTGSFLGPDKEGTIKKRTMPKYYSLKFDHCNYASKTTFQCIPHTRKTVGKKHKTCGANGTEQEEEKELTSR
jgi:tetratricopeptide (TPR) repeat protein